MALIVKYDKLLGKIREDDLNGGVINGNLLINGSLDVEGNLLVSAVAIDKDSGTVTVPSGFTMIETGSSTSSGTGVLSSYYNETYNIGFSYPDKYILVRSRGELKDNQLLSVELNSVNRSRQTIVLEVFKNEKDLSVRDWVESTDNSNFKFRTDSFITTYVATVPSVRYRWSDSYDAESVAVSKDKEVFLFTITNIDVSDGEIASDDLDKVLSSVVFKAEEI